MKKVSAKRLGTKRHENPKSFDSSEKTLRWGAKKEGGKIRDEK